MHLQEGSANLPLATLLSTIIDKYMTGSQTQDLCVGSPVVCPLGWPEAGNQILRHLSKTMHSAASLRNKGRTLSLLLHAQSKHKGRRKVLLGQGIF